MNEIAGKPIHYVYDSISTPETQRLGERILAPGGNLVVVLPPTTQSLPDGKSLYPIFGLCWTPENAELAPKLFKEWSEELLPLLKVIIVASNIE